MLNNAMMRAGGLLKALAALTLLIAVPGCGPDYALEVNGVKVSMGEYKKYLLKREAAFRDSGAIMDKATLREKVREELIIRTIIMSAAGERGITASEDEVRAISDSIRGGIPEGEFIKRFSTRGLTLEDFHRDIREDIIARKFRESFADISTVPLEEVRARFLKDRPLQQAEGFKAGMLRFKTRAEADKARAELKNGVSSSFQDAAGRLQVGDKAAVIPERWIKPGEFPEIAAALRTVRTGSWTAPINRKGYWYVAFLEERREEVPIGFQAARFEIMAMIIDEKREDGYRRWLNEARKGADININRKLL
jgi:parvulin-like peptidyl-prolyl isomerase